MNFLNLIILYYYYTLSNSLITFEIYSSNLFKEEEGFSTEQLQKNNYDNIYQIHYYTNLSLGNPLQNIPFLINFKSPFLFITHPLLNRTYINENSTTFNYINNPPKVMNMYFDIFNTYYLCSDIFNINNDNYTFNFLLGLSSNKKYINNYIGLSPKKQFTEQLFPFLSQLKISNNIISNVFVIYFDKTKNSGKIIFGGYPHDYEPNKYKIENFRILNEKDNFLEFEHGWEIKFNHIQLINYIYDTNHKFIDKNILFEYHEERIFRVNIESNYISLNKDLSYKINKIIDNLFHDNCFKYYKNNSNNYYFICDEIDIRKFPSLMLSFKPINFIFEFDYIDLFLKKNNKYFLLLELSDSNDIGEIGLPFLFKYNLVFHETENIIGFYIQISDNKDLFFIPIIIFSIFINFIFIYLYIRRLYKRKNIKNIDYSYINNRKEQIENLNPIK